MRKIIVTWTTSAGGAATVYGHTAVVGRLYAIDYLPGTTDTGATVTVTSEGSKSHTLLVKATAGTSNLRFYPRDLVHKTEDGAALTGTSGGDRCMPLVEGQIKVVIASGGNVTSGSLVAWVEDHAA